MEAPGHGPLGAPRRGLDRVWLAALSCVLIVFLVLERRLDLEFPVPWPDEGSFLWQALAFRDGFSLFAPEIHAGRQVLWMPPAFMVIEGLVFRVLPFSLRAARMLSSLYLGGAVACLGVWGRDSRARLGHVAVSGVFLVSCPIFALAGNVARMETLVVLLVMAGFLLLDRGRAAGLGFLALGVLVHPNGAFAAVSGMSYFFWPGRPRRPLGRADRAVIATAALAWVAYAVYVATHFGAFVTDMKNQLRFKEFVTAQAGGMAARLAEPVVWGGIALLVAAWAIARGRVRLLVVLGGALLAQGVLTAGWLYDVYPAFAALVISIAVLEATTVVVTRLRSAAGQRAALALACITVALVDARFVVTSPFLERSLDRATVLRKARTPVYFTSDDHAVVAARLQAIALRRGPIHVQFVPDGEGLLFADLRGARIQYVQQTFFDMPYDVAVVHDSVWVPPYVRDLEVTKVVLFRPGPARPASELLRIRDETERWVVYEWPAATGTLPGQ